MLPHKELYASISAQLPVFFQAWWLDAVCDGTWDVALVQDEDGVIVAALPYQIEKKWGFTLLRTPRLTPYLGPIFLPSQVLNEGMQRWDWEDEMIAALLQQLPRYDYLQFHSLPGFTNFLPLLHKGVRNTNRITYHLDLTQSEAAILAQIQKRRRRYIRNGDADLQLVSGAEYQTAFLAMHRHTFEKKNKKYPYSQAFLAQLMQTATAQQSSRFWAITTLNGQLVAALWVVFDKTTMYQLLSAYNEESSHHAAMSMLTWHAIVEAQKMGLTTFDFEGSIDPGIEPFFRKFGAARKPFLAFEQYRSVLWRCKKFLLG